MGQSEIASEPSFMPSVSRLGLATLPASRWSRPMAMASWAWVRRARLRASKTADPRGPRSISAKDRFLDLRLAKRRLPRTAAARTETVARGRPEGQSGDQTEAARARMRAGSQTRAERAPTTGKAATKRKRPVMPMASAMIPATAGPANMPMA